MPLELSPLLTDLLILFSQSHYLSINRESGERKITWLAPPYTHSVPLEAMALRILNIPLRQNFNLTLQDRRIGELLIHHLRVLCQYADTQESCGQRVYRWVLRIVGKSLPQDTVRDKLEGPDGNIYRYVLKEEPRIAGVHYYPAPAPSPGVGVWEIPLNELPLLYDNAVV